MQVQVGPRYPDTPPFAFRAPPPASRIGTTPPATATVENATAVSPGPRAYWNGTDRTLSTRLLVYRPTYRRYGGAPDQLLYEHSLVAKRYEGTGNATAKAVTASQQRVVLGRTVTLVTLAGAFNESTAGVANVDIRPAADGVRSVTVFNDTHPITLSVPTRLPEGTWREALADQRVSRGGHVQAVDYQQRSGEYNRVEIRLEPDVNYTLRLGRVTLGDVPDDGDDDTGAVYVTPVGDTNRTLDVGENETFTVEVRDRYNNPVSGVTVNWSVHSPGNLSDRNVTTGPDGRATVTYTATDGGEARIEASIDGGPPPAYKSTNFSVDVGGGLYNLSLTIANSGSKTWADCSESVCTVDYSQMPRGKASVVLETTTGNPDVDSGVIYSVNNSLVALNESTDSLSDGSDTVEVGLGSDGWTQVTATAAGASTDTLSLKIEGGNYRVPRPTWRRIHSTDQLDIIDTAGNGQERARHTIQYDVELPNREFDSMDVKYAPKAAIDGNPPSKCKTGETVVSTSESRGTITLISDGGDGGRGCPPENPDEYYLKFTIYAEDGTSTVNWALVEVDGISEGSLEDCLADSRQKAARSSCR